MPDPRAEHDGADLDELTRRGPPSGPPMWFVRAGSTHFLHSPADLHLEDGTVVRAEEALPPDLPIGYHDLLPLDGGLVTRVVVTPGRCHLPHDLRTWGLSAQLYASRSEASWGIGDLADLRRLGRWASGLGAGVLATSPLHAPGPAHPVDPSPYHPSSRRHLNPLHLRVETVPGADGLDDLQSLAAQGRALSDDRRIDRDRVWNLKRRALELACTRSCDDPRLDAFLESRPSVLAWATYCAIADVHGNDFRLWPGELRRPDAPAVARFATEHAGAVQFHQWLQWVLDLQLAEAASTIGLVQDLAVGFDAGGADAWELQDLLALDMRIGAPADDFNTAGQNWGLPPFVPWRLRHALYQPFVDTVRASLRHASESGPAGGLRIDHVMGLFRQFWVPLGETPAAGSYVRYPAGELLDILALESHRAGAFVVGEDLGTVEDSVRSELADRQVLSYRLLWFEDHEPVHWPRHSFGALATHDLPTVAGLWHGTDPGAAEMDEVRGRLARAAQPALEAHHASSGGEPGEGGDVVRSPAEIEAVIVGAHRALGQGASRVVVASLDDLLAVEDRPNHPGTLLPANWTTALPETIEALEASSLAAAALERPPRRTADPLTCPGRSRSPTGRGARLKIASVWVRIPPGAPDPARPGPKGRPRPAVKMRPILREGSRLVCAAAKARPVAPVRSRDDVALCQDCLEMLLGQVGVTSTPTLPVVDLGEAVAFYERAGFGVRVHTEDPDDPGEGFAFVDFDGQSVFDLDVVPIDPARNGASCYLIVDGADDWRRGCRRPRSVTEIADQPWGCGSSPSPTLPATGSESAEGRRVGRAGISLGERSHRVSIPHRFRPGVYAATGTSSLVRRLPCLRRPTCDLEV